MNKILGLVIIAGLFASCSSQATTSNDIVKRSSNSSAGPVSDPSVISNSGSSNEAHTPTRAEIREKLRQKSLINAPSSGPLPAPQFHPAAENSMISTTMNPQGAVVETRVFKDNPQLARIELTWVGPKDNTLKIYLRDGRVVQAKADNIENLGSTPVSVLLKKAGIQAAK